MSNFRKAVAKEIRDLQKSFKDKQIIGTPAASSGNAVDRSVAEQVNADLDGLIKKHEGG